MKREDRQSDGRRARQAGGQRERERKLFLSFLLSLFRFDRLLFLRHGPRRIIFYFASFRNSSDASIVGAHERRERERLSRTRLNPRSDQRSFRRGEDSLTDNTILSSVVLLLKMISRHENWPRQGFWTPVGTQCT